MNRDCDGSDYLLIRDGHWCIYYWVNGDIEYINQNKVGHSLVVGDRTSWDQLKEEK